MFPEHGRVTVVISDIKPQMWKLEQEAEVTLWTVNTEAERHKEAQVFKLSKPASRDVLLTRPRLLNLTTHT